MFLSGSVSGGDERESEEEGEEIEVGFEIRDYVDLCFGSC